MKPLGRWVRKDKDYLRIGSSFGCKSTGSKRRGIEYHRKVYRQLSQHVRNEMQGWTCLIEPWYKNVETGRFRQPDAVLLYPEERVGIVVEAKLNWKDGRDVKLIDTYLPIVKQAEDLDIVWPLLVTRCLRGYPHPPILQLAHIHRCQSWLVGDPTPLMLLL